MPAASSALSNKRPAGPTKGLPVRSSSLPGCSPTNMTFTRRAPSPKTVCVPFSHRSQARQSAAALFNDKSVGRGGIKAFAALSEDLYLGIVYLKCETFSRAKAQRRKENTQERGALCAFAPLR